MWLWVWILLLYQDHSATFSCFCPVLSIDQFNKHIGNTVSEMCIPASISGNAILSVGLSKQNSSDKYAI